MGLTLQQAAEHLEEQKDSNPNVGSVADTINEQAGAAKKGTQLLIQFGDRIERMTLKHDQIDEYGEYQWKNDFTRLSTIEDLGENLTGEKLREWIWTRLPNSKFKRFQEAFSKPEDRIIPQLYIQNAQIVLVDKTFDENSVKGCLADPDLIPESLLTSLGLMEPPKEEDGDITKLESKYACISALKKVWESSVPLERNNLRILVVERPTTEIEEKFRGVANPPHKVMGTILYSREYEPKRKTDNPQKGPRRLVVDVHQSVYSAFRKTGHQDNNYEEREIPDLAELYNDIKTLNEDFDDLWTVNADPTIKNALKERANELVVRGEILLSKCREGNKVRVYELLQELNDKIEAKRVGAAMSKMVAAYNGVNRRNSQVRTKGSFNAADRKALEWQIDVGEQLLKSNRLSVQENAYRVGIENLAIYVGERSPDQMTRDVKGIMRGLRLRLPKHAASISTRPLVTYVSALNEMSDRMEQSLRQKNMDGAMDDAVIMHVIGKLQAANVCIEELKCEIAVPERASMQRIRMYVSALNDAFARREVFASREPMHIAALYEPVEAKVRSLNEVIQEASPDIQSDPDTFQKYCKSLRASLDTFDLEATTWELMEKVQAIE